LAAQSTSSRLSSITYPGLTWTDISGPTSDDLATVAKDHGFHPLDVEDALSTRQLTKVEVQGRNYAFVCLAVPAQGPQGVITPRHVSMFIGNDFLVTLHPSGVDAISRTLQQCQTDQNGRMELMKSPAYLGYDMIDGRVDGMFDILDDVQASLDGIEKVVFNEKKSHARMINTTRRQIAELRRMVFPLQLYLPDLALAQKFSKDDLCIYFNDLRHKMGKVSRILDGMKDEVEIYNDTDFATTSNRTNQILAILTIIFTLTLPAAVVAALYGMNVPMPGALTPGAWEFLGTFTSLMVLVSIIVVVTGAMAAYFKRAGWF